MSDTSSILTTARRVIEIEAKGLAALSGAIGDGFAKAVAMILAAKGRVIVSGMGKSGHIARKIAATVQALGAQRFDMKYSMGGLPHDRMMSCIELYGAKVIPMVREILDGAKAA